MCQFSKTDVLVLSQSGQLVLVVCGYLSTRLNHIKQGHEFPELGVGTLMQNFKHQISCIAMQQKAYQSHNSDSFFTNFQNYIFTVHQITTSGEKFNLFLARE